MITAEHRRVYTFAPVIPGRRRRFTRIADAYRALAEQLIERRYSYREHVDIGEGESRRVREWTERGAELFIDGDGLDFQSRRMSDKWRRHVGIVAARLRRRDEYRSRKP